MKKGMFVVLEGIDGSGKATQLDMLHEWMSSLAISSFPMFFPNHTFNASFFVKSYLQGKLDNPSPLVSSMCYIMERLYHQGLMQNLINQGKWILCDRYSMSNKAYQSYAFDSLQQQMNFIEEIDELEHDKMGNLRPDLTIILDVSVKTSTKNIDKRGRETDILEDNKHRMNHARSIYRNLVNGKDVVMVQCEDQDGNLRSVEDIHEDIKKLVLPLIRKNYEI